MSTTAPDQRITTYQPTVATTEFAALFPIFDNDDIAVIHNGEYRTDFTVTATYTDAVSNDARVHFANGLIGKVMIVGERAPRRQNRFGPGPIPARDINLAFDTIQGEMQEARRDIDRSAKSSHGSEGLLVEPGNSGDFLIYGPDNNVIPSDPPSGAGNMNTAVYDPQGIGRDAFDRKNHTGDIVPIVVLTRAALKSLDTTICTTAVLKEGGREGWFVWKSGNYSAQITADTQEGVFIKADAVAASAGAWVRDYKGPLQATWFGARVGSDNAAAVSGALSLGFALSNFLDLEFPGGQFDFSTSLSTVMPNSAGWSTKSTTTVTIGTGTKTFTVPAGLAIVAGEPVTAYRLGLTGTMRMSGTVASYSGTTLTINVTSIEGSGDGSVWNIVRNYRNTAAFACLKIRGAGKGLTKLNWPSAGGGLKVKYRSQQHSIDIQGLSMTTGAQSGGTALDLQNEYPFFGEFTSANYIDVDFHGSDGQHLTNYWTRAIDAADVSQIDFMSSRFGGASTPNGAGIRTRAVVGDFVCVFDMGKCQFRFLSTGYEYGHGSQTAQMIGTFFGMNITDVFGSGTNHQGLSIISAECFKAADGDGVYLSTPVPNFVFALNKWGVHAGKRGVVMEMADASTILGNQFFPDVTGNTALAAVDIIASVAGSRVIIDDNKFDSVTVGARLFEGTSGVRFGEGNTCTVGMTDVQDFGTGNSTTTGYGVGSGGTVTQATSKTTAVTLNKPSGVITTNNAALAAGARVAFTVNCNRMKASDTVVVVAGNGNYSAVVNNPANGSFTITLKNESGGSLSDAVAINFTILKGSSA